MKIDWDDKDWLREALEEYELFAILQMREDGDFYCESIMDYGFDARSRAVLIVNNIVFYIGGVLDAMLRDEPCPDCGGEAALTDDAKGLVELVWRFRQETVNASDEKGEEVPESAVRAFSVRRNNFIRRFAGEEDAQIIDAAGYV